MKREQSDHFRDVAAVALKNITFRRESDKPIPGIDVPASGDQLSLIPDSPSPVGHRTIGTPSDDVGCHHLVRFWGTFDSIKYERLNI